MKIVNEIEFAQAINQKLVLVDFYADWCGPCKMAVPVLEQLSLKYSGEVEIIKLNIDESPNVVVQYGVQSVPTMILFKEGQEIDRQLGFFGPGSIEAMLKKHLS